MSAAEEPVSCRTLIIYRDLTAAREAMDRLAQALRQSGRHVVLHPLLWRIDQLGDPRWRGMSLADGADADWIVFATPIAQAFSPAATDWLQAAMARRSSLATQVMTLAPDEEPWMVTLEPTGADRSNPARAQAGSRVFFPGDPGAYFAKSA